VSAGWEVITQVSMSAIELLCSCNGKAARETSLVTLAISFCDRAMSFGTSSSLRLEIFSNG